MPDAIQTAIVDPMTAVLKTYRQPDATDWANAWVGMEPTFQTEKTVRKWWKMVEKPGGEDAYFKSDYMLGMQKKIMKATMKEYQAQAKEGGAHCLFARVEPCRDCDPWKVRRQNLLFYWKDETVEPFEMRLSLDPETFEYTVKPVPLAWFYDERFITFLEEFMWKVPMKLGCTTAIGHGGAQFSLSVKTYLGGSLLADDIAFKVNHPELATWIMDWPNPDDRAFRATKARFAAFQEILKHYWAGDFHPNSIGILTAENAYLDRGFGPIPSALAGGKKTKNGSMDPKKGPIGDARDIFQTNFAFGRAMRLQAQNVHPGYWQAAHPDDEGYRPDQIMRYSEGNLNRLQILGELHVKSGKVLEKEKAPELTTPLEAALLASQAGWENRAQMGRTSARDYTEALLLSVHHAQYLEANPHVAIKDSILQDQILGDAEETLKKNGGTVTLDRLHREARQYNLDASHGRMNTDWIEPESLFWAAWRVLPPGEKTAIACEAISGFADQVDQAASVDQRPQAKAGDPMEWHRHRIHPLLWQALQETPPDPASNERVLKELAAWQARKDDYLARRPHWSPKKDYLPPWEATT